MPVARYFRQTKRVRRGFSSHSTFVVPLFLTRWHLTCARSGTNRAHGRDTLGLSRSGSAQGFSARVRSWLGSCGRFRNLVTGPTLQSTCVVAGEAPLRICGLDRSGDIARARGQRVRWVAVAALWNVPRNVRDVAVGRRLLFVRPQIIDGRRHEFIERSMTR